MTNRRAVVMAIGVVVGLMVLGVAAIIVAGRSVVNRVGAGGRVRRVGQVMPAFEASDLQGRIWRLDDLRGKVAYVNVWATWCAPCREELPHVQELFERTRGRDDIVFLTMNVDEHEEKVAPFVAQGGYSFPVLFAREYVRGALATQGIPRNWVIDRNGVWHVDEIGFLPGGDWVAGAEEWISAALAVPAVPATAGGSSGAVPAAP
ncbi:MAG: TlpA disulfide reductase family protein [Acidobacteriota bacterium]